MAILPRKYKNKPLKNNKVFMSLAAQVIADSMSIETFELIYNYIDGFEIKAGLK